MGLLTLQIIAGVIPVVGVAIVATHRIEGFYILNFGQLLGFIYFCLTGQWCFALQMIALTTFNSYGIYSWKKRGVGKEPIKLPWRKKDA